MDFEQSDILGGSQFPHVKPASSWSISSLAMFTGLSFCFGLFYLASFLSEKYTTYQEANVKKATRRRYGIPDNDHRPFAVAHAAAQRAIREKEGAENALSASAATVHPTASRQIRSPLFEANNFRSQASTNDFVASFGAAVEPRTIPETHTHGLPYMPKQESSDTVDFAARYDPNYQGNRLNPRVAPPPQATASFSQLPSTSRGHKTFNLTDDSRTGSRKHGRDDEDDETSIPKKSKLEGEELIDGDEEPGWIGHVSSPTVTNSTRTGIKRPAADYDDVAHTRDSRGKDKKARLLLTSPEALVDELLDDMEVDVEARGTKRQHRDIEPLVNGIDPLSDSTNSRRKRHMSQKKDGDHPTRGQKRDRDVVHHASEDDCSQRKRWKRKLDRDSTASSDSDVAMDADDSAISDDPSCIGRRLGDEWESNGIKFKVGPDRRRLRLELVKRTRPKFVMPQDSRHPDMNQNMAVYVEAWLTEEEYRIAKSQQQLAWQEGSRSIKESVVTPENVKDPLPSTGKSLLWSSPQKNANRRPLKESIVTNVSAMGNPFQLNSSGSTRRVASAMLQIGHSRTLPPSPSARTNLRATRSYSKWEKQELEAKAMQTLRESASALTKITSLAPDSKLSTDSKQSSTLGVAPVSTADSSTRFVTVPSLVNTPATTAATAENNPAFTPTSFPFSAKSSVSGPPVSHGETGNANTSQPAMPAPTSGRPLFPQPANTRGALPPAVPSSTAAPLASVSVASTTTAPSSTANSLRPASSQSDANPFAPASSLDLSPAPTSNPYSAQRPTPAFTPTAIPTQTNGGTSSSKFNFAFANPPSEARAGSTDQVVNIPPLTPSAVNSGFSLAFKQNSSSSITTVPAGSDVRATSSNPAQASLSFGMSSQSPAFGTGSPGAAPNVTLTSVDGKAQTIGDSSANNKPLFSFGGASTAISKAPAAPSNLFGNFGSTSGPQDMKTSMQGVFGGLGNGAATTEPSENPKPSFSFNPTATPASSSTNGQSIVGIPKNAFNFTANYQPASVNGQSEGPKPTFNFGGSTTPAGSPFGNPANTSSPSKPPSFAFGSTTPAGTPSNPPPKPAFGFGGSSSTQPVTFGGASGGGPTSGIPGQPSTPYFNFASNTPTAFTFGVNK